MILRLSNDTQDLIEIFYRSLMSVLHSLALLDFSVLFFDFCYVGSASCLNTNTTALCQLILQYCRFVISVVLVFFSIYSFKEKYPFRKFDHRFAMTCQILMVKCIFHFICIFCIEPKYL